MNAASERAIRRVCVAVDAAAHARDTLDAAGELAAALDAELAGFFLEDVNLLRAAELSFTREMGIESGVSRPLQVDDVERSLRVQAQAMRDALERTAAGRNLRWSFATLRVSGVGPVLALAQPGSVAVVAPRADGGRAMGRRTRARMTAAPVAVFDDGTPEAAVAMRLASMLAGAERSLLLVLHAGGGRDAAPGAEDSKARGGVRHVMLPRVTPAAIAAAVAFDAAGILVVTGAPFGSAEKTGELLARVACPVVVVTGEAGDAPVLPI